MTETHLDSALHDRLEQLQRRQNEFVAMVGHELRVPLTSLKGILSMLASGMLGPMPDKAQTMLEVALQSTDRMARLVSDLLDLQRLESGRLTIVKARVEVLHLLEAALEIIRPLAETARVALRLAAPAEQTVEADPDRVVQTLTNLLSNAVKFSPPHGTVQVTAETRGSNVVFSVADEGRGLPPDRLVSIFEPFEQVHQSDSREKGGTGLGLTICRGIVEQHGGHIWAENRPSGGSLFSFSLPIHG